MKMIALGKYWVIVVTVAMFLVFDLGVLALNFVISAQISNDAISVNLAGRQRMVSQRTAKVLWQIHERVAAGQPVDAELKELRDATRLFDETLNGFIVGGQVTGGSGEAVRIDKVEHASGVAILQQAKSVWAPYRAAIERVLAKPAPTVDDLAPALATGRAANLEVLKLMNQLTTSVEEVASHRATVLRSVQVGGITLATLNFVLILFHFIRKLRQGDLQLEQAKKETDDILVTVNEGLFLLDSKFVIGQQHSAALQEILGQGELGGRNFVDVLRKVVTEKTIETTLDYLTLLFGDRVNEKLVRSLNPLDVVEVNFDDRRGGFTTKFLEFRFNRVLEAGKVAYLLVTVNDATRRIVLERELKVSQERAKGQMDILVEVLNVESEALRNFLESAASGLDQVNTLLRESATPAQRHESLGKIYRILHRLKGDASGIGMSGFAGDIHEVEDIVAPLRDRPAVDGNELLPLAVRLEKLFAQMDSLRNVAAKFAQIRGVVTVEGERPATQAGAESAPAVQRWAAFAQRLAEKHARRVALHYHGVDPDSIAEAYREPVSSIVNQFIRNSIVHGIESAEQRLALGKAETGSLAVYVVKRGDGGVDLSFRDDGAGLKVAAIRDAAVRKGLMSAEEAAAASSRRLVELIFEPAFSTREAADEDGGRGVGLDLVRAMVSERGGHIRIGSTPNEFCHFRISFPPPPMAAAPQVQSAQNVQSAGVPA